jgi:hypothetical protein
VNHYKHFVCHTPFNSGYQQVTKATRNNKIIFKWEGTQENSVPVLLHVSASVIVRQEAMKLKFQQQKRNEWTVQERPENKECS